jgi:hypothetical protein
MVLTIIFIGSHFALPIVVAPHQFFKASLPLKTAFFHVLGQFQARHTQLLTSFGEFQRVANSLS